MSRLLVLLSFALRFLLSCFRSSLHGGFSLGQSAGGLLVRLDVAGQMLAEFGIELLGRAGIGEWGTESRIVVGLSMGDYVDAERLVIHLGYCDEHSAAGKKWHEFNEDRTSLSWHMR